MLRLVLPRLLSIANEPYLASEMFYCPLGGSPSPRGGPGAEAPLSLVQAQPAAAQQVQPVNRADSPDGMCGTERNPACSWGLLALQFLQ